MVNTTVAHLLETDKAVSSDARQKLWNRGNLAESLVVVAPPLALPAPAPVLALPGPDGELRRLVARLTTAVADSGGIRWTEDGPDFTDLTHLGNHTISVNRGSRYRGGSRHSNGVTVTGPDGVTVHFDLCLGLEALKRLIKLLQQRHRRAETARLKADLAAHVADLDGYVDVTYLSRYGRLTLTATGQPRLVISVDSGSTTLFPHVRDRDLYEGTRPAWHRQYAVAPSVPELHAWLRQRAAMHNRKAAS